MVGPGSSQPTPVAGAGWKTSPFREGGLMQPQDPGCFPSPRLSIGEQGAPAAPGEGVTLWRCWGSSRSTLSHRGQGTTTPQASRQKRARRESRAKRELQGHQHGPFAPWWLPGPAQAGTWEGWGRTGGSSQSTKPRQELPGVSGSPGAVAALAPALGTQHLLLQG